MTHETKQYRVQYANVDTAMILYRYSLHACLKTRKPAEQSSSTESAIQPYLNAINPVMEFNVASRTYIETYDTLSKPMSQIRLKVRVKCSGVWCMSGTSTTRNGEYISSAREWVG